MHLLRDIQKIAIFGRKNAIFPLRNRNFVVTLRPLVRIGQIVKGESIHTWQQDR